MNVGVSRAAEMPAEVVVSSEDSATIDVSMKVNIGHVVVNGVKTTDMSEFFVTKLADIMAVFGIKSVAVNRYSSGFGCKVISSMMPFDGVPNDVLQKGVISKDAIGQLMSVANLTRIELRVDGDEYGELRKVWESEIQKVPDQELKEPPEPQQSGKEKGDGSGNIRIVDVGEGTPEST